VKFGHYTSACHFSPVDHAAIARACGCNGVRIETAGELSLALKKAIHSNGPWLMDIITDPAAYPPISLYDPPAAVR